MCRWRRDRCIPNPVQSLSRNSRMWRTTTRNPKRPRRSTSLTPRRFCEGDILDLSATSEESTSLCEFVRILPPVRLAIAPNIAAVQQQFGSPRYCSLGGMPTPIPAENVNMIVGFTVLFCPAKESARKRGQRKTERAGNKLQPTRLRDKKYEILLGEPGRLRRINA